MERTEPRIRNKPWVYGNKPLQKIQGYVTEKGYTSVNGGGKTEWQYSEEWSWNFILYHSLKLTQNELSQAENLKS